MPRRRNPARDADALGAPHVVFDSGGPFAVSLFRCLHCGAGAPLPARCPFDTFIATNRAFVADHAACVAPPGPPLPPRQVLRRLRVLDALAGDPRSFDEVAATCGVSWDIARATVAALHAATPRQVHIAGWRCGRGKPAALYAAGGAPDVPCPPVRDDAWREAVHDRLTRAPMTTDALAAALAIPSITARRAVTDLHGAQPKRASIVGWQVPARGPAKPVYAAGDLPDVPRPALKYPRVRGAQPPAPPPAAPAPPSTDVLATAGPDSGVVCTVRARDRRRDPMVAALFGR